MISKKLNTVSSCRLGVGFILGIVYMKLFNQINMNVAKNVHLMTNFSMTLYAKL